MLNTLLPILLFAAIGLAVLGALRRVFPGQALEGFVHRWVGFGAGLVQGQHRLVRGFPVLGDKALAHAAAADLAQEAPAFDHGFTVGGWGRGGWLLLRGERVGAADQAHQVAVRHGMTVAA